MLVTAPNRRAAMTLYTGDNDPFSHQVRIVMVEKSINVDIIPVAAHSLPEDLIDLNPYNTTPTLTDRDLVLYESHIIMEYLDERYPHPALFPAFPVERAKARLLMFKLRQEWFGWLNDILDNNKPDEKARHHLTEALIETAPLFSKLPFFMNDEFSLLDCYLLPLLWRLPAAGINLPPSAKALTNYMEKMFARRSFVLSLTDEERKLR